MEELLTKLGIDWKILIAQLVNFGILAFVLSYYLYKPIIRVLDNRKKEIEKNKNIGSEIQSKLQEIEVSKDKILKEARHQSESIIKASEKSALKLKEEILESAKKEQERIIQQGQTRLEEERIKLITQIKHEVGDVVTGAIERTVGDFIDAPAQKKLTANTLRVLEKTQ